MPDSAHITYHRLGPMDGGAIDLAPLGVPDAAARAGHQPDETLVALRDDKPVACCSVWLRDTPQWDGQPAGVIGHFGATDGAAAAGVLAEACGLISTAGMSLALGLIDGTTWRRYRLVTDAAPGGRPREAPFFLEPQNPPEYVDYFTAAGFAPLLGYHSAITPDLAAADPRAAEAAKTLADAGIRIRPLDLARLEEDLASVYRLSVREFADNPLYTPITREEFVATYRAIAPRLVPGLVLLAERDGELAGFNFTLPDLAQAARGETVDRVIVKSLAVGRAWRGVGLGAVLVDRARQTAREMGFRRLIYALMHDENPSARLAERGARPFRRYAVFARVTG